MFRMHLFYYDLYISSISATFVYESKGVTCIAKKGWLGRENSKRQSSPIGTSD